MTRDEYKAFLENNVFRVDTYGQFKLMFELFEKLNAQEIGTVGLLERSYIYSGRSIFSALLEKKLTRVIDYKPETGMHRSGFQSSWLDKVPMNFEVATSQILDTGSEYEHSNLPDDLDTLLIPNVLHHCRDFREIIELLLDNNISLTRIFIFDSYIREQHQYPDDFCRYTVPALDVVMRKFGFKKIDEAEYGNIFDGMLYFIEQASVILEHNSELSIVNEKIKEIVPILKTVSEKSEYRSLGRPHASYASAYTVSYCREAK